MEDLNWTACKTGRSKILTFKKVEPKTPLAMGGSLETGWSFRKNEDGPRISSSESGRSNDFLSCGMSTFSVYFTPSIFYRTFRTWLRIKYLADLEICYPTWKWQLGESTLTNWVWFEIICSLTSPNSRLRPTIYKFNTCTVSSSAKTLIRDPRTARGPGPTRTVRIFLGFLKFFRSWSGLVLGSLFLIKVSTESLVNTFWQGIWLGLTNLRRALF